MTDWTTPEDVPRTTVERLHRWLLQEGNPEDAATPGERAVADIIRAFWPVPPPTLAEELAHITEHLQSWTATIITRALNAATTRAKQTERDLADTREALAVEGRRVEKIAQERDEARAEVERLTAEQEVLNTISDHYNHYAVQKGTQEGAESLDPADVPPGEAWLVEVDGERRNAVKDRDPRVPWNTVGANNRFYDNDNKDITLIARLVPEPRVITSHDELEQLAATSIIRDSRGEVFERTEDGWGRISIPVKAIRVPVTVLWEPVV